MNNLNVEYIVKAGISVEYYFYKINSTFPLYTAGMEWTPSGCHH